MRDAPTNRTSPQRPPAQPATSTTSNLIAERLRYALSVRGFTQRTALAAINTTIRHLEPSAIALTGTTFSRITTGKRAVRDYELLAIAQAINVAPAWLLGYGNLEPVAPETP